MRFLLVAIVLFVCVMPAARAQEAADEKYIAIHTAVEQAENLAEAGDPRAALASLTDVQGQMQQFQKVYPDWNPAIISYRLKDLAAKIATINAKLAAAASPPPAETGGGTAPPPQWAVQEANLRAQLQSVQAENQSLQAKLKEALASQPAVIDSGELAKAQEEIRNLMKANDLLQASVTVGRETNSTATLRRQLTDALDKYTAEHARAQQLIADNAALQRDLKQVGPDTSSLDLLRSQNERLTSQLASLQAAANNATAAGELAAKLKAANTRIDSLETSVSVVTMEKRGLETKVTQLSAELEAVRATNYDGRIRDLIEQRDQLAKALKSANEKNPRRNGEAELLALTNEMQTLRARLAVAEAKPVPYSDEELAMLRQTAPRPSSASRSIHELPPGASELVVSAQRHFSNHEFDEAEADYQKILDRDQNNGLVLANMATIELQQAMYFAQRSDWKQQQRKLADADKHITAALVESPDDAYNLSTLGFLKYTQTNYDAALDALSRAASLDPNNPEIQNYLGVTLSHKGQRVQAEAALRRAVQLNPNYAPAHNNLAVVYLNQTPSMPMLARWHYEKAIAAGQPRIPELEKMLADKGAPVDASSPAP